MNLKALSHTSQTPTVLISQLQYALLICFTQGLHALIKFAHGGAWSLDKRIVGCWELNVSQLGSEDDFLSNRRDIGQQGQSFFRS